MQESRAITRKSASNLALAFVLLPRAKRDGMSALYAFCREVDDVADEEGRPLEQRRAALARWREDLRRAYGGLTPELPVNRELKPFAERDRIYIPLSELARSHVSPEEILRFEYSPRFFDLAASVAERARHFYRLARMTLPAEERRSMVAAELMGSVYWRLLRKLETQT